MLVEKILVNEVDEEILGNEDSMSAKETPVEKKEEKSEAEQQEIIDNLGKYFKDIVTENYQRTFKIEKDDIENLIGMTPLKLKTNNLKIEQITIDLNVYKMAK